MRTITEAAAAIRGGQLSSRDLVSEAIEIADRHDADLGMFLDRYSDAALAAAVAADDALAAGAEIGPLHGIPIGIKDIITTLEGPTTGQSVVQDPAAMSGDAVAVQRLRDAGAIIVGKLTTMEYAMGAPDPTKPFPIPRNPWNPGHWTGGSSSGSASAVATGAALGTLGSDTGGSIRGPAAYCGISGLKPTYGRVPLAGSIPLAFSLDHLGPMARTAKDCALMLEVIAGHHPSDPSSSEVPVDNYSQRIDAGLSGVRIGADRLQRISLHREDPAVPDAFSAGLRVLEDAGAVVEEIELPFYEEMVTAHWVITVSEALAYHRNDLVTRWGDYSAGMREAIGLGTLYSGADYVQAQRARTVGIKAMQGVFENFDLIVTPTAVTGAPSIDAVIHSFLEARKPSLNQYWCIIGSPALTVPIGFTEAGLPLGLQLAGRPFDEALVLRAGTSIQRATDWHLRIPATLSREG